MRQAVREKPRLLVPHRRLLVPDRRVLRPRLAIPGIAPYPRATRPPVVPGSANYTTPGTYSFTVPNFNSLTADARGAGGGGGGYCWSQPYGGTDGGPGGYSYFNAPTGNMIAYGGGGGTFGSSQAPTRHGSNGANGTSSGGDYNGTGGGALGGNGASYPANTTWDGGRGGDGARCYRTWVYGSALVVGMVITVVVGAGGTAGYADYVNIPVKASAGGVGAVYISWS